MKRFGDVALCSRERRDYILSEYRRLLCSRRVLYLPAICREISLSPAPRFFVSDERAAVAVGALLRGVPADVLLCNPTKRAMYVEIARRVRRGLLARPGLTLLDVCGDVVRQGAPCLYMMPSTVARVIRSASTAPFFGTR